VTTLIHHEACTLLLNNFFLDTLFHELSPLFITPPSLLASFPFFTNALLAVFCYYPLGRLNFFPDFSCFLDLAGISFCVIDAFDALMDWLSLLLPPGIPALFFQSRAFRSDMVTVFNF